MQIEQTNKFRTLLSEYATSPASFLRMIVLSGRIPADRYKFALNELELISERAKDIVEWEALNEAQLYIRQVGRRIIIGGVLHYVYPWCPEYNQNGSVPRETFMAGEQLIYVSPRMQRIPVKFRYYLQGNSTIVIVESSRGLMEVELSRLSPAQQTATQ